MKIESSKEKPLSVYELNVMVSNHFKVDPQFAGIYVRGEISNFTTNSKSKHSYFTLKDENSQISALIFSFNSYKMLFKPQNGMKVIAHGTVGIYIPGGQYQINVDSMEPDGIGALHIAYEQLHAKLEAEGLFDPAKKKPLPKRPASIGVVTSPTGAAVRDIINVSTRRFPYAKLTVYPAAVQGERSAKELIAGVKYFNSTRSVDVIIIGRGGGSIEDLWSFNDENLARVISASEIPVISAVGHERDFTICDDAADVRAPTPSAAAEYAVPDTKELVEKISNLINREENVMLGKIARYREYLMRFSKSKALSSPDYMINGKKTDLENLAHRLATGADSLFGKKSLMLRGLSGKLDSLSPLAVLSRGYGAVFTPSGDVVTQASLVAPGDDVHIRMRDGEIVSRVTEVNLTEDKQ